MRINGLPSWLAACFCCLLLLSQAGALVAESPGPMVWTDTSYPEYITKVTDFGELRGLGP